MKRVGGLWEQFCSFENLYHAFKKAFRSTKTDESFRFAYNLVQNLSDIQQALTMKTYIPGNYSYFTIHDPKERIISVASFRDRVVHHGLINVLEPIYESVFIADSYATRKNKGTHAAAKRAQGFCRQNKYYLKMDIRKYFDSINHAVLTETIHRKIKDPLLLNLCRQIIGKGGNGTTGLPIGNLTSQFLANVYLDPFDHWVKETLCVKHYLRYMDDFILFHNNKLHLKKLFHEITAYLTKKSKLNIKFAAINQTSMGLPFLGLRIFPALIRIRRENLNRTRKPLVQRMKEYKSGRLDEIRYEQSLQSLYGLLSYWDKTKALKSHKYWYEKYEI